MADHYVKQQVGVADGTKSPPDRADGREVHAHVRKTLGSKVPGTAWASGDRIYLGTMAPGRKLTSIKLCTDTSLGTATIDIGDGTTADKFVDGATLTATNTPTELPIKASTLDDDPSEGETVLWATVGVAAIAAGTLLTFQIETVGIN